MTATNAERSVNVSTCRNRDRLSDIIAHCLRRENDMTDIKDLPDLPKFKVFDAKEKCRVSEKFCITDDGNLCFFIGNNAHIVLRQGRYIIEIGKERYRW